MSILETLMKIMNNVSNHTPECDNFCCTRENQRVASWLSSKHSQNIKKELYALYSHRNTNYFQIKAHSKAKEATNKGCFKGFRLSTRT